MTGEEHYDEAERLAASAGGAVDAGVPPAEVLAVAAVAQVHATLALAYALSAAVSLAQQARNAARPGGGRW